MQYNRPSYFLDCYQLQSRLFYKRWHKTEQHAQFVTETRTCSKRTTAGLLEEVKCKKNENKKWIINSAMQNFLLQMKSGQLMSLKGGVNLHKLCTFRTSLTSTE